MGIPYNPMIGIHPEEILHLYLSNTYKTNQSRMPKNKQLKHPSIYRLLSREKQMKYSYLHQYKNPKHNE